MRIDLTRLRFQDMYSISCGDVGVRGLSVDEEAPHHRVQWWELGPWANLIMMRAALPYVFSGILPVGAKQTIAAVNMGRAQTIAVAKLTAIMVSFAH